jgi:hypothetical protein
MEVEMTVGFEYLEPIPATPLTETHMRNRMWFSQQVLLRPDNIQKIIFTDESQIICDPARKKIWRVPGEFEEEWQVPCSTQSIRRMAWGAIGRDYKSDLVLIDGTLNGTNFVPLLESSGVFNDIESNFPNKSYFYQQDGAKCHTARVSASHFQRLSVPMLQNWPSRSPDLNPIEQI